MNMTFERYLRLDSPLLRGNDVLALQKSLKLPEAQQDGVYGNITQGAVSKFQRNNQLKVDGIVGPKTWAAIFGHQPASAPHETGPASSLSELQVFHSRYSSSVRWRLTNMGIEIEGSNVETTGGEPQTVRRICKDYKDELVKAASATGVPVELIIACMCTESFNQAMKMVNPRATRKEPGYINDAATPHRVSYGLMQCLLSTARQAMAQLPANVAVPPQMIDREWLFDPANALLAGAAYIAEQSRITRFDPPVVACAYNAGSVFFNAGERNRWKMRQFPIGTDEHTNRFVKWFNDCFRVFKEDDCPFDPAITFWHKVQGLDGGQTTPSPNPLRTTALGPSREFVFPQRKRPPASLDYKSGGRQFGANRAGGQRKHAGCDLKAPKGTEILAMADGEVIRGPYYFYEGTYALEIRHGKRIVRYGEISSKVPKGIKVGAKVSKGQLIAFVGQLNSGNSMLHLEMYSGEKTGPLTQAGNPFKRRGDLIDPTPFLDKAPLVDELAVPPVAAAKDETEDASQTPKRKEDDRWEAALMAAPTTGASAKTAAQDDLLEGVETSKKMAEADLPQVKKLASRFQTVASKHGLPGSLLAALASRESRCGSVLDADGWGDRHNAYGILQVDKRYHDIEGLPDPTSLDHLDQAAGIFSKNLDQILEHHDNWEDAFILKGAVVAYNAGIGNVKTKEEMDKGSTGDDYGSDVIARAQYYQTHMDLDELRL